MSKFFTYEDRLILQKGLKESLSIKAIAVSLDKNPTTVSREIKKYSSEIATGYPGFPFNECKNRFNCRTKIYAVKNVPVSPLSIVRCVLNATVNVRTLLRKSAVPDSDRHMFVTAVKLSKNVPF